MKAKALVLMIVCILTGGMVASAQSGQEARIIQVRGSAVEMVEPDTAILRFAVELQADTAQKAQSALLTKASALIAAMQASGIMLKNIKTDVYRISPIYSAKPDKQNNVIGYRAETTITVSTDNLDLVSRLIDNALAAGANVIQSLDFSKKDLDMMTRTLIEKACLDARRKAETAAKALGMRVGLPRAISVNDSMLQDSAASYSLMKSATQESVAPGQLELQADVSVTFELLPVD
ncbi:MAG: SIMPL domain-containing protein [Rectinema sp.]|nr:SIMPL domain-containing protein [Rectinema sp.]